MRHSFLIFLDHFILRINIYYISRVIIAGFNPLSAKLFENFQNYHKISKMSKISKISMSVTQFCHLLSPFFIKRRNVVLNQENHYLILRNGFQENRFFMKLTLFMVKNWKFVLKCLHPWSSVYCIIWQSRDYLTHFSPFRKWHFPPKLKPGL